MSQTCRKHAPLGNQQRHRKNGPIVVSDGKALAAAAIVACLLILAFPVWEWSEGTSDVMFRRIGVSFWWSPPVPYAQVNVVYLQIALTFVIVLALAIRLFSVKKQKCDYWQSYWENGVTTEDNLLRPDTQMMEMIEESDRTGE